MATWSQVIQGTSSYPKTWRVMALPSLIPTASLFSSPTSSIRWCVSALISSLLIQSLGAFGPPWNNSSNGTFSIRPALTTYLRCSVNTICSILCSIFSNSYLCIPIHYITDLCKIIHRLFSVLPKKNTDSSDLKYCKDEKQSGEIQNHLNFWISIFSCANNIRNGTFLRC